MQEGIQTMSILAENIGISRALLLLVDLVALPKYLLRRVLLVSSDKPIYVACF